MTDAEPNGGPPNDLHPLHARIRITGCAAGIRRQKIMNWIYGLWAFTAVNLLATIVNLIGLSLGLPCPGNWWLPTWFTAGAIAWVVTALYLQ